MEEHCGKCKYMGWKGLTAVCRHPNHHKPLPRWPFHCRDYVPQFAKPLLNDKPWWAPPVREQ